MLRTYRVQRGVGIYLQKGAFSSRAATFLKANLAASIIFCGSESGTRDPPKQPNRTSKATSPIPAYKRIRKSESFEKYDYIIY